MRRQKKPQESPIGLRQAHADEKRQGFRRAPIWILIAVLIFAYVFTNVLVAFGFTDVARWLGVHATDRYKHLAILGDHSDSNRGHRQVVRAKRRPTKEGDES